MKPDSFVKLQDDEIAKHAFAPGSQCWQIPKLYTIPSTIKTQMNKDSNESCTLFWGRLGHQSSTEHF